MLAFITLLHATGTPKTRLQISIAVEGLVILVMAISGKTIPPVSYQTALDCYLVFSLVIISCVVIGNTLIEKKCLIYDILIWLPIIK